MLTAVDDPLQKITKLVCQVSLEGGPFVSAQPSFAQLASNLPQCGHRAGRPTTDAQGMPFQPFQVIIIAIITQHDVECAAVCGSH